jgi:hypothetical protein
MKIKRPACFYPFAVLLLYLVGCTANDPYRRFLPITSQSCTNRPSRLAPIDPIRAATIETNATYNIGYVEFDDQGWLWAHQQWQAVKDEISIEASNSASGLTIVVFVHGWESNARYDDPNVQMFRRVLSDLGSNIAPRKIFGVYVGWRGLTFKSNWLPPLGNLFSFYNRKNVAERIGHQGAATQVFTELEMMQDDFNLRTNVPPTELVIIGHSFGGQLVFSAVSQVLTERLLLATRRKNTEPIRSLGNLVILLNPAFESSLYNNLISLATSPDITYPTNQAPVLAVFTSKSDWATGIAFPAGRALSTWAEDTRPSKGTNEVWLFNVCKGETPAERRAILETLGHDSDYITYDLNYTNYGPSSSASPIPGPLAAKSQSLQLALGTNNLANSASTMVPYVFADSIGGVNYACILQPRTNAPYAFKAGNPFLDVAVDKRIMNGHSDISNPVILNFLRDFILFTRTNYPSRYPTYKARE